MREKIFLIFWLYQPSVMSYFSREKLADNFSSSHQSQCMRQDTGSINPLSPNIHVQILQTDLYTFP